MNFEKLVKEQGEFFYAGKTRSLEHRLKLIDDFSLFLTECEEQLCQAILKDLGRDPYETYMVELGMIHREIKFLKKKLKRWMKPKLVTTDLANFPAKSWIIPYPYGRVLVIGTWNYPLQLTLLPALAAIAAGNTVVLKLSYATPNVAKFLESEIEKRFDKRVLAVVEDSPEIFERLLASGFEKVFFTGGAEFGRKVAEICGRQLIPCTLELGGKSPAIILKDADLQMAARRIAWGKFLNAGQTCVAPDFVYVEECVRDQFLLCLKNEILKIYGSSPFESPALSAIVNERHFSRLQKLLENSKIYFGGQVDPIRRKIAPTVIYPASFEDVIMKDEIFGPLLPVLDFSNETKMCANLLSRPKPLALYVFSSNHKHAHRLMDSLPFGGGAINDTVLHMANHHLPFGGIGESGIGSYHGQHSLSCFSHFKAVLEKSTLFEYFLKYTPYSKWKKRILQIIFEGIF